MDFPDDLTTLTLTGTGTTTTQTTVRQQLQGVAVGTDFAGVPAPGYAGRIMRLIDPERNGHAVFEPVGLREDVFVSLEDRRSLGRRCLG